MKKTLLIAFVAVGIGIITALPLVGATDPLGVLFLKRVDMNEDNTEVMSGTNSAMLFDIVNGYSTPATIVNVLLDHIRSLGVSNQSIDFTGSGFSFSGTRGASVANSTTETTNFSFATTGLTLAPMETQRVSLDVTTALEDKTISKASITELSLLSGSGVYLADGSLLGNGKSLDGAIFSVEPPLEIKKESDFLVEQTVRKDIQLEVNPSVQFYFDKKTTFKIPTIEEVVGVTDGLSITIPEKTTFTGSGSTAWDGKFLMPRILGLPMAHDLPSTLAPIKRISIGSPSSGIILSKSAIITVPVSGEVESYIYSSQDGAHWAYEKKCRITKNSGGRDVCSFEIEHFTEFLFAREGGVESHTRKSFSGNSGGGGQNSLRHGNYDPNHRGKKTGEGSLPSEVKTTVLRRSAKALQNYIPCDIDKKAQLANRLYNVKLLQGAPKKCREKVEGRFEVPYRVGKLR